MSALSLCGSTGSIGTQALDVVRAEPGRYDSKVKPEDAELTGAIEKALSAEPGKG